MAVALLAVLAAPAYGQQQRDWHAGMDDHGNPTLVVWPRAGHEVQVYRCPGDGACEEQPRSLSFNTCSCPLQVEVGTPAPGDVFEARFSRDGSVAASSRTPAWRGVPRLVRRTSVRGKPVVGRTVTAVDSQWSGGWAPPWYAGAGPWLTACRHADGTHCFEMREYRNARLVLNRLFEGWYVFARSTFSSYGGTPPQTPVCVCNPGPRGPFDLPRGPRISVSEPIGPIAAAPNPRRRGR